MTPQVLRNKPTGEASSDVIEWWDWYEQKLLKKKPGARSLPEFLLSDTKSVEDAKLVLELKDYYVLWSEGKLSAADLLDAYKVGDAVGKKFPNQAQTGNKPLAWWQLYEMFLGEETRKEMLTSNANDEKTRKKMLTSDANKPDVEPLTVPLFLRAHGHPEIKVTEIEVMPDHSGTAHTLSFDLGSRDSGDDAIWQRARALMVEIDHIRGELETELNANVGDAVPEQFVGAKWTVEQPYTVASKAKIEADLAPQRAIDSFVAEPPAGFSSIAVVVEQDEDKDEDEDDGDVATPTGSENEDSPKSRKHLKDAILKRLGLNFSEKDSEKALVVADEPPKGTPAARMGVRKGWELVEIHRKRDTKWEPSKLTATREDVSGPHIKLAEVLKRCVRDIDVSFSFRIPPGLNFPDEDHSKDPKAGLAPEDAWTVEEVAKGSMADIKGIKAKWTLVGIRMTAESDNKQYVTSPTEPIVEPKFGTEDDFIKRLKREGGKIDGSLTISLSWNTVRHGAVHGWPVSAAPVPPLRVTSLPPLIHRSFCRCSQTDDLDICVTAPSGKKIDHSNKVTSISWCHQSLPNGPIALIISVSVTPQASDCGGTLDVEMNAEESGLSTNAVQSVLWQDEPPQGSYKIEVVNRTKRSDGSVAFHVMVKAGSETTFFSQSIDSEGSPEEVATYSNEVNELEGVGGLFEGLEEADETRGDSAADVVTNEVIEVDAEVQAENTLGRIDVDLTHKDWRTKVLDAVGPALVAREKAEKIATLARAAAGNNATSRVTTDTEVDTEWMLELEMIKTKKIREEYNKFVNTEEEKSKMRSSDAWHMLCLLDKPGDDECVCADHSRQSPIGVLCFHDSVLLIVDYFKSRSHTTRNMRSRHASGTSN